MARSLYSYLVDTQANIEAATVEEGALGYATDLDIWGNFDGTDWIWGLIYGEIYVEGIDVEVDVDAQDVYVQVLAWSPGGPDGINGEAYLTTPDVTEDHITILKDRRYFVRWHVSCYAAQKQEYEFEVFINDGNVGYPNTEAYRTTSVASAVAAMSGGGICTLLADDTVELWVERKDGGSADRSIIIRQATLTVMQLSGINIDI